MSKHERAGETESDNNFRQKR
jgi:hypothetical protein